MKRILICLSICFGLSSHAAEWTQFRGADGNGVSTEKNLPVKWSKDSNVKWRVELPGRANSSPAVSKDRVVVTTQMKDSSLWILSYSTSGKLLKKIRVGAGKLAAKGSANLYAHRHNPATPTPIVDKDHIWAFFGTGLLVCVSSEAGDIKWKKDLTKLYGAYDITFGFGSSPRLWKDLLIVHSMTKGPSYIAAFNKTTGEKVWFHKRKLPAKFDGPDAYSTPSIAKLGGREVLLISGSDHVTAHDPRTGKQLWISGGLTINSHYGRVIASPTGADDVVIATTANPGGKGLGRVIAINGVGKGNITKSNRLWTQEKSTPDSSTPVCYKGRVYLLSDQGIATCLELKTGKQLWRKRVGMGPYHASLVAGDDKIYFMSTTGDCTVVQADDEGTILSKNTLPGGNFYSTPAISNGRIYIRSYGELFAIE